MSLYFIKTPAIIQKLFKNYSWRFSITNNQDKIIYLTFDDGPTPEITNWALNTLKEYNAKATFFCIGKNIENHPELFNQILSEGHAVGNHTHNHLNGWKTSTKIYINNVLKTEDVISKFNKNNTKLFRPPYGRIKKSQGKKLKKLGYNIIMWDVLSADFDTNIQPEKCHENVIKNTDNGGIVIFHDSLKAEHNLKYALPKVLKYFSAKGYKFKAIS